MVFEGAGPKFRPHSVVCCCAVVWWFHEMNIFANYLLLLTLLLSNIGLADFTV
jgi:hypothetical protein